MTEPSRSIALYGTDEQPTPPRVLRAGHLSVELEAGNLRYLRWGDEEVLRAVSFIVRDKDWGTYNPKISDLDIKEDGDSFHVTFRAVAADDGQSFAYRAAIEGRADGTLTFHGEGETAGGFLTNRTGFVILHPIDGVSGAPVTIEHTAGQTVETTFPEIIDPVQPMMDLRALTHHTPGGTRVETRMEGDTYEMEDQRNWTDSSYKTYVRPLAQPWPYNIEPGERIDQTITVSLSGSPVQASEAGSVRIKRGATVGTVPPLGLGLRPENVAGALDQIDALKALAPSYFVLHHDPRAGHDQATLAAMLKVVNLSGADAWLEAVITEVDTGSASEEIAALGDMVATWGQPFTTVLVSPAPDMKCTLPGSPWPPAPDAATLYDATRAAFPQARIGGGMFSYFTELNRKRPPVDHLDLVSFTTSPMVHAGDDRSVMETREAHPAIVRSVTSIADGKPWSVGPSAIGVRDNPYGEAAKDNPGNVGQAMNRNDPRQRGLLGAAWTLGYFADFATGEAASVAFGAPTGSFGAIDVPSHDPRPWFDAHGGVYPLFHVLRGLSRLRGEALHDLGLPPSGPVCGFSAGEEIWLANTGPDEVSVALAGVDRCRVAMLDAASFVDAAGSPGHLDAARDQTGPLTLDAFAVARIVIGN